MPNFVITFNAQATVCAKKTIEAETLADAKRIAREMGDADKPDDIEFADPAIMDRRDIAVVGVEERKRLSGTKWVIELSNGTLDPDYYGPFPTIEAARDWRGETAWASERECVYIEVFPRDSGEDDYNVIIPLSRQ